MCIDLSIYIPAGYKAGKYLQRYITPNEEYHVWYDDYDAKETRGIDLKSLVEGLDSKYFYCALETSPDSYDYTDCMRECHSCMSKEYDTYGETIQGYAGEIVLVTLYDSEQRRYVARSLVNVKNVCFNTVYGDKHYLLEMRLLFCGFEKRNNVFGKRIKEVLTERLKIQITDYIESEKDTILPPDTNLKTKVKKFHLYYDCNIDEIRRVEKRLEKDEADYFEQISKISLTDTLPKIKRYMRFVKDNYLFFVNKSLNNRNEVLAGKELYENKKAELGEWKEGIVREFYECEVDLTDCYYRTEPRKVEVLSRIYNDDIRGYVYYPYTIPDCYVLRGSWLGNMFCEDNLEF